MEDLKVDGLVIIRDSIDCGGEPLWMSLMRKAQQRAFIKIRLLLTISWSDTLERRYGSICKENMISMENIDELETLLRIANQQPQQNGRTAFFMDSLNVVLMWCSSLDHMIRLLKKLAVQGAVVARIHEEDLLDSNWQRLSAVADVTLCLRMDENGTAVCKSTYYKKSGKRVMKEECFKVEDQYRLSCSPYVDKKSERAKSDNPLEEIVVPFDIGLQLSESELKAKHRVKLPYMAAQTQEGLVGISASGKRKVRAGGRIIYTPDEADDLDESDPDDDLQI